MTTSCTSHEAALMSQIKPTHKASQAYYAALRTYAEQHAEHEGALRGAATSQHVSVATCRHDADGSPSATLVVAATLFSPLTQSMAQVCEVADRHPVRQRRQRGRPDSSDLWLGTPVHAKIQRMIYVGADDQPTLVERVRQFLLDSREWQRLNHEISYFCRSVRTVKGLLGRMGSKPKFRRVCLRKLRNGAEAKSAPGNGDRNTRFEQE